VICSTIFLLTGALGLALLVAPMAQGLNELRDHLRHRHGVGDVDIVTM
jgi:hypothetical protein